jgi:hypothetical protein
MSKKERSDEQAGGRGRKKKRMATKKPPFGFQLEGTHVRTVRILVVGWLWPAAKRY